MPDLFLLIFLEKSWSNVTDTIQYKIIKLYTKRKEETNKQKKNPKNIVENNSILFFSEITICTKMNTNIFH